MSNIDYKILFKDVDRLKKDPYVFGYHKGEVDTPVHQHNKGQLIYAEHGTLNVEIKEFQYFLPVKHFAWIPPYQPHRIWSNNTHLNMITFYFDVSQERNNYYKTIGVYKVNSLLYQMMVYANQWTGHIKKENKVAYTFFECLKNLLPEIGHTTKILLPAFVEPRDTRIAEVLQYIRLHLDQKLGMEEIASRFGLSSRSLSRLFNEKGSSYTEYLQSLRIVKSMELMAEKNMNVNMAADQVGYESYSAFSKVFLRYTGMKPMEYIKKNVRS